MLRFRLSIEGATEAHHHVVRSRGNHDRVVAEFPHGPVGALQATIDAHRRNRDPGSSHPLYFADSLNEQELFYDKNGVLRRHVHHDH